MINLKKAEIAKNLDELGIKYKKTSTKPVLEKLLTDALEANRPKPEPTLEPTPAPAPKQRPVPAKATPAKVAVKPPEKKVANLKEYVTVCNVMTDKGVVKIGTILKLSRVEADHLFKQNAIKRAD
jgi:hypothetical protein